MTNEEKLMDLYRHKGYTDGQARAAARQMITDITREINLQNGEYRKLLERWQKCWELNSCTRQDITEEIARDTGLALMMYTEKR
jgi:hypothetical protein